ncbi:MAG: hypothetical protein Q8K36_03570 [Alphaproteobacteria bacterium]|nr:hypothetical protein [Alphaproteobacteria bacterium]
MDNNNPRRVIPVKTGIQGNKETAKIEGIWAPVFTGATQGGFIFSVQLKRTPLRFIVIAPEAFNYHDTITGLFVFNSIHCKRFIIFNLFIIQ